MQDEYIAPVTAVGRRPKVTEMLVLNDDGSASVVGTSRPRPQREDYNNFNKKGDRTSLGGSNPPDKVPT